MFVVEEMDLVVLEHPFPYYLFCVGYHTVEAFGNSFSTITVNSQRKVAKLHLLALPYLQCNHDNIPNLITA
jgi:hypothetical protein